MTFAFAHGGATSPSKESLRADVLRACNRRTFWSASDAAGAPAPKNGSPVQRIGAAAESIGTTVNAAGSRTSMVGSQADLRRSRVLLNRQPTRSRRTAMD
jgi:hypothetical protein